MTTGRGRVSLVFAAVSLAFVDSMVVVGGHAVFGSVVALVLGLWVTMIGVLVRYARPSTRGVWRNRPVARATMREQASDIYFVFGGTFVIAGLIGLALAAAR